MSNLKQYIKEVIEELEEVSLSGSVGGVSTPVGTGPRGQVMYKDEDATDEEYRKDKKKNKSREGSVQHTLKNG